MGLDIVAFSHLQVTDSEDADQLFENPDFPGTLAPFHDKQFYEQTDQTEVRSFRAGSYSGYSRWRACLAELTGTSAEAIWESGASGPFVELINYSDCEGMMGPVVAEKLYADFCAFEEKAQEASKEIQLYDDPDIFYTLYQDWKQAFDLARQNGVVIFC